MKNLRFFKKKLRFLFFAWGFYFLLWFAYQNGLHMYKHAVKLWFFCEVFLRFLICAAKYVSIWTSRAQTRRKNAFSSWGFSFWVKGTEANKNLNSKQQFYDVFTSAMSMLTRKLQHKLKTSEKPQPKNAVLRRVLRSEHCFDPQSTTFLNKKKVEVFRPPKTSNKTRVLHTSKIQNKSNSNIKPNRSERGRGGAFLLLLREEQRWREAKQHQAEYDDKTSCK